VNNTLCLLPNEHIRSYLFRIHYQSPFGTFPTTAKRFGFDNFRASSVTTLHKLDVDLCLLLSDPLFKFWYSNCGGNYMLPFMTKSEVKEIRSSFQKKETQFSTIHARTLHNNAWRYCSTCREHDLDRYGVSYYHHPHQVAGVFHCYKHKSRLISHCANCDYKLSDLSRAPVPPAENKCPSCRDRMVEDLGYFDDFMTSVESFCLSINQHVAQFTLNDIQNNNLTYIGLTDDENNTLAFKRSVSHWNKELWQSLGKERLQRYFNNTIKLDGITMSPTLKTPRHFLKDSSFKFSPPLVYILAMHATNTIPSCHVLKMD